ncbi:MAG: DUF6173 family protein [Pseudomonadota bacterium]
MTEFEISGKLRTKPVLPDAGVFRTDCADTESAENQPLPVPVAQKTPEQKSPAQWAYERLVLYIQKFEETLDSDHEVGMGFAGSDAGMLNIQGMGFFAPDMITFYGVDPAGAKTQLVQHVSQLNVMLKAAPKLNEEPARIGFQMRRKLEDQDENTETVD